MGGIIKKKLVMVSPIPSSVSSSIQLLMFQDIFSVEGIVEYLSKEEIFLIIRCMMYKHFGEVLSIRFTPAISKTSIVLNMKEIRTPVMVLKTKGFMEINPFTRSIYLEIIILENREERIQIRTTIYEGYVVKIGEEEYEVRYYI